MRTSERDLLVFHLAFGLVAAATLLLAPPGGTGPWLLVLVLLYHLGSVTTAIGRRYREWTATWTFAAVLSVWMVLPDAVLVGALGVLRFPPDGVPDVLGVTLPMAGLWAIPTVLIVSVADAVTRRMSQAAGYAASVLTAAAVFTTAEASLPHLPVWEPVGVTTFGTVAPYILPAQALFGVLVVLAARWCRGTGGWVQVGVAGVVALAYTGAATVSWLLIEKTLLG